MATKAPATAAQKTWSFVGRIFQTGKSIPSIKNMDTDDGAPRVSRTDADYKYASGAGPNAAGLSTLEKNRVRSRHEYLTNEYVHRAKQIRTAYTVGGGLRPHIKGDPNLQRLWDAFVINSDPSGLLDFYAQQALAFGEQLEGGEVIALPRNRLPEDGLPVPLQIQLLESEHMPIGRIGGMPDNAIAGVELDLLQRPVAYWLYDRHPAEGYVLGTGVPSVKRYPADRVFHIFEPTRTGQLRGSAALSRVLSRIRNVENYEKADLMRKEVAALLGVAVKMPAADDDVAKVLGLKADDREEGQTWAMAPLEPGGIFGLPPGADISVVNPNDSSTGYKEAWQTRYFGVATGLGVPYFLLTGDFSNIEERSLRFAMIDFHRTVEADRRRLNHQLNRKVWRAFLDAAERAGWKPAPGKTRADFEVVEWIGEPLPHIHPVQEVTAQRDAIRSGLKTFAKSLQESGSDLETFIAEKQAENALLDAAGIILDCDPRHITKAGGAQDATETPTRTQRTA
ncbi:phage portal protein [Ruixingdingia sedimenti]|uniref:Phage portal protein n=1 Tax=Ruixingdingia sedimenti TaxID=3073604 RepID=A0ABU1FER9_9RHOB|nr:phage portal protein [Xinfangfangia sp. LG-4]MDR5654872.1 phage portal protein [Xinfangfangia sp. LG-4]